MAEVITPARLEKSPGHRRALTREGCMRFALSIMAVFLFWLILAQPLERGDLLWGVVVAVLVGCWAAAFVWAGIAAGPRPRQFAGLALYTVDLIRSIVPAALQVAYVVMQPSLPVRPSVIQHRTTLEGEAARVAFANTITLTPGTHCVDFENDIVTVHCLDDHFAERIQSGQIEARIAPALEGTTRP